VVARVYMLLFVLEIVLTVLALISCLSAYEGEVRGLPRILWVIVIVLFPIGGAIIYYVAGRPLPAGATPGGGWLPGPGPAAPDHGRQAAPDDDPAFLRSIDAQARRSDEELLRRWEEDLKKREDDLRKPEETPPSDG
jgi:hypothetical protein